MLLHLIFYKRALHLFSGLILLVAEPAFASAGVARPCRFELDPILFSADARRTLRITDRLLDFAAYDPQSERFLRSLSRIFQVLDDWTLDEIAPYLGGDGPAAIDLKLREHAFFKDNPTSLTVESASNYENLEMFAQAHDLDAYTLGLLSSLFPDARHLEMQDVYVIEPRTPGWIPKLNTKIRNAMKHQRFRRVAVLLLSHPGVRGYLVKTMNAALIPLGMVTSETKMNATANRIRMQAIDSEEDEEILFTLFTSMLDMAAMFGHQVGDTPYIQDGEAGEFIYERLPFLDLLERFHLESLHLQVGSSDLMAYVDHLAFDRPPPLTAPVLRDMMLKEAARLLMPLKTRFSRQNAIQLREQDLRLIARMSATIEPTQLKPVDSFPIPPPTKKRCQTAAAVAVAVADVPLDAPATSCQPSLPPELDLRTYSSYVEKPLGVEKLDEHTTYFVDFERFNETNQPVRFSHKMVHWMKKYPGDARELLDAFILGRARPKKQNGFKLYHHRTSGGERVHQIKCHGTLRGILFKVDHVWQIVAPSHKDTLHKDTYEAHPL